jgi:transcriptional regulator with XRE-family HTH domain
MSRGCLHDETVANFIAMAATDDVLREVGQRLRDLRKRAGITLAALAETTGISVSTLSRLESGQRKATLELLLPLARAHRVPLDELVGAPPGGDPRVNARPIVHHNRTILPLTQHVGSPLAFKTIIAAGPVQQPDPRTHEGYEWIYVLSGQVRLVLGGHDLLLTAGEAAEFDCRTPHWFGSANGEAAEFLSIFGSQGERMHVRARPKKSG